MAEGLQVGAPAEPAPVPVPRRGVAGRAAPRKRRERGREGGRAGRASRRPLRGLARASRRWKRAARGPPGVPAPVGSRLQPGLGGERRGRWGAALPGASGDGAEGSPPRARSSAEGSVVLEAALLLTEGLRFKASCCLAWLFAADLRKQSLHSSGRCA